MPSRRLFDFVEIRQLKLLWAIPKQSDRRWGQIVWRRVHLPSLSCACIRETTKDQPQENYGIFSEEFAVLTEFCYIATTLQSQQRWA